VRPLRCSLLTQTSWNRLESRRNKPFRAAGKNHRLQGTASCWEIGQDPGTAQVVDVLLLTLFKWHGRSSSGMYVCVVKCYTFLNSHAMLCYVVKCIVVVCRSQRFCSSCLQQDCFSPVILRPHDRSISRHVSFKILAPSDSEGCPL
jgi:hypothetical protein